MCIGAAATLRWAPSASPHNSTLCWAICWWQRTHVQTRTLAIAQPQTAVNDGGNGTGHQNAVLEINSPEADEQSATEDAKFNWNKAWYPIAATADLETDAPTGMTIIGRPLAVWWDRAAGKWQVYADQCPHRLAPLSEGSISEEGHLRCSYHGWTFKGDSGECTHIPQAPDGKEVTKTCLIPTQ